MSKYISPILTITVVALAVTVLLQLLEMEEYNLFTTVSELFK